MAIAGSRQRLKLIGAIVFFSAVAVAWFFLQGHADTTQAKAWVGQAMQWIDDNPGLALLAYALIYIGVTGLSLPGATVLTLIGGSLFGFWVGVVAVSCASVIGATIAMVIARCFLRETIEQRFPDAVQRVNKGINRDGASYLFALRLIPAIPFFLVNLVMGLTRMNILTYAWVSQIAMLPATFVYVNAGQQLATIEHPSDILSARVVLALTALAALPFVARFAMSWWRQRQALRKWSKPPRFDFNLIVIGAGSAGLVTAYIAAAARAKVALIEQNEMGGDCLNTGCIPSKTLIRSAKLAKEGADPSRLGLTGELKPDFTAIMQRIRAVIARVAPHDSMQRYRDLGVEVIAGHARLVDPWTVDVDGRRLTARRLVLATGAEPVMPPIPGLADREPLTSETLWSLSELPPRLLVLGGGAIGCELAQAFARFGSQVTIVEALPRLLAHEDADVSDAMHALLLADGIDIVAGAAVTSFEGGDGQATAVLANGERAAFDRVLVAVGRRPRLNGFGLEELGLLEKGRLSVDEKLRTRLPTVYAAGDVIGQLQFTHAAGNYGWFASMNALFDGFKSWQAHSKAFPIVIYTDPEIARVGMSEGEARQRHIEFDVTRYDLAELDRAIADGANEGFVKILTPPGKDRILGVTIVGARAGDMLGEFTLAMRHGLGLNKILQTIHPYPSWSEAAKSAAGEWRRAHVPDWLLRLSSRFLAWRRG
ncbi:MAG: pyridine nucleotide-disulfide oxidoreductase dimerization region [Alphaproteobacteria bacterium]|nr:pyridine nucleotide-disulfide oxidoreductase dimerization region [Alphaproteobacteria bacterium]